MELYRTFEPRSVCVMRRDSVKGTPKGDAVEVSEERLAQIVAATRFAGAGKWKNVAVHPPILIAMESGANVCAVETGANPRLAEPNTSSWRIFDQDGAAKMLNSAGYEVIREVP